jgi:DNA modification methylase
MTPVFDRDGIRLFHGDCLSVMAGMEAGSVDAIVTSPPYWGAVRDYGDPGQLGLEREPADYVAALVGVFRESRRLLRPDGTLWLNIGDVYAASGKGGGGSAGDRGAWESIRERKGFRMPPPGYKMKDLTLVAFQVADALRRDGWYLRATIVWKKAAAVEPMRADRPAVSHEYLFLLSPSEANRAADPGEHWWGHSVWEIRSGSGKAVDHPATMPFELARRCIVAGTRTGDAVLDPFAGGGTTLEACMKSGRRAVGIEISTQYIPIIDRRCRDAETPLLAGL